MNKITYKALGSFLVIFLCFLSMSSFAQTQDSVDLDKRWMDHVVKNSQWVKEYTIEDNFMTLSPQSVILDVYASDSVSAPNWKLSAAQKGCVMTWAMSVDGSVLNHKKVGDKSEQFLALQHMVQCDLVAFSLFKNWSDKLYRQQRGASAYVGAAIAQLVASGVNSQSSTHLIMSGYHPFSAWLEHYSLAKTFLIQRKMGVSQQQMQEVLSAMLASSLEYEQNITNPLTDSKVLLSQTIELLIQENEKTQDFKNVKISEAHAWARDIASDVVHKVASTDEFKKWIRQMVEKMPSAVAVDLDKELLSWPDRPAVKLEYFLGADDRDDVQERQERKADYKEQEVRVRAFLPSVVSKAYSDAEAKERESE